MAKDKDKGKDNKDKPEEKPKEKLPPGFVPKSGSKLTPTQGSRDLSDEELDKLLGGD
jgi:hypothetical protein